MVQVATTTTVALFQHNLAEPVPETNILTHKPNLMICTRVYYDSVMA